MPIKQLISALAQQARAYDTDPSPARARVLLGTLLRIEGEATAQLARGSASKADWKALADLAHVVREAGERSTQLHSKDFGRYVESQLPDFRIAAGLTP